MKEEIWKPVKDYEGLYEISDMGRVKRLSRVKTDSMGRKTLLLEKILSNKISIQTGYPCINLSKDGKVKTHNIHVLIADAFIPNPDNLPCINHIDEDRANSVLSNLERCSYAYNNMYGTAGTRRRESLKKHNMECGSKLRGIMYGTNLSVNQYDIEGNLVKHFKGGAPEVQRMLGLNKGSISACCRHESRLAYGYVWRYEGDPFSYSEPTYNKGKDFSWCKPKAHQKYVILLNEDGTEKERYKSVSQAAVINGFDRHAFSRNKPIDGITYIGDQMFIVEKKENEYIPKGHKGPRPDLAGKLSKPVCQYTKEGEFIAEFNSVREAALACGKPHGGPDITNCCKGNLKTAYGYIWRHKDDNAPEPFKDCHSRKIAQYTYEGELVGTYDSIMDAIRALGKGTPTSIGNNLAGRSHSAYNYVWKYIE